MGRLIRRPGNAEDAMTTIHVFDPRSLPAWARRDPAVVALCERDLVYRADVNRAQTAQYRRFLRREARRIMRLRRRAEGPAA